MPWHRILDNFLEKACIPYKEEEPLSPYTTIKIGGKAKRALFPRSKEDLIRLLNFFEKEQIPYFVMGGGSNLLVSDNGFDGAVIILISLRGIKVLSQGEVLRVKALAGTRINELIAFSRRLGYGGFEFLAGVPATLGGAVRMNAGAFGVTTSQLVKRVELYREGEVIELEPRDVDWSYRAFRLDGIIISAELEFRPTPEEELRAKIREIWAKRVVTQPVSERTFGSTFKNPPCCYAGALIEQAGLKGYQIGEAKISEKHANFIVNLGRAKAEEVLELIRLAQKRVYERFQILLEPEVKFLGISYEGLH